MKDQAQIKRKNEEIIEEIRTIRGKNNTDDEIINKALRYYYKKKFKGIKGGNESSSIERFVRDRENQSVMLDTVEEAIKIANRLFRKMHLNIIITDYEFFVDDTCTHNKEFSLVLKNSEPTNASYMKIDVKVYLHAHWLITSLIGKCFDLDSPYAFVLRPDIVSLVIIDKIIDNLKQSILYDAVIITGQETEEE